MARQELAAQPAPVPHEFPDSAVPKSSVKGSPQAQTGRATVRGRRVVLAVVLLVAISGAVLAYLAAVRRQSQSPGPGLDGSCAQEPELRSTNGPTDTSFTVSNLTSEVLTVHWIDYGGARKRWFDVPPQGKREQRTARSHPWVVTRSDATCLQIIYPPASVVIR